MKIENPAHAVALHFMHYNFCRIHKNLRITPAMVAGVSDHAGKQKMLLGFCNCRKPLDSLREEHKFEGGDNDSYKYRHANRDYEFEKRSNFC